ncbi:MAG: hypothetical protein JO352_00560 [Chloroflexi bacterium]|nr:hypothetical protein [Chloroflexota bacterium]
MPEAAQTQQPPTLTVPEVEPSGYGRPLQFAGYTWQTKVASIPVGPGPNYFTDDPDAVWVDDQDRLHLRLAPHDDGQWYAAEVVCTAQFGYGRYRFYLDSADDALDPNVVLGLFTWDDDPTQNHRELDIEFGRFGLPNPPMLPARYTVQPYQDPDNVFQFAQPPVGQSIHSFTWSAGAVAFQSWVSDTADALRPGDLIASHTFTQHPVARWRARPLELVA